MFEQIERHAKRAGIPPEIVYGICMTESRMNPLAARYEDHYKWLYEPGIVKPKMCSLSTEKAMQKTSWGLMQVMGAVYREYGYTGWLSALPNDIDAQLEYGCKHLSKKIKRYGVAEGILAYNSGSPRRDKNGHYVNAYYLARVERYAKQWSQKTRKL